MHLTLRLPKLLTLLWLAVLSLAATAQEPAAQPPAATVALLTGSAQAATPDGQSRPLHRGDAVYAGEQITTLKNSYLNLLFTDDGRVLLRPGTVFRIVAYQFPASVPLPTRPESVAPTPEALKVREQTIASEGRTNLSLIKGAFRAITGLIGAANRDHYKVGTPVATIGIRGTDFAGYHDETTNTTTVAVYRGGIDLVTATEQLRVDPGQFGRADGDGKTSQPTAAPAALEAAVADDPAQCD